MIMLFVDHLATSSVNSDAQLDQQIRLTPYYSNQYESRCGGWVW